MASSSVEPGPEARGLRARRGWAWIVVGLPLLVGGAVVLLHGGGVARPPGIRPVESARFEPITAGPAPVTAEPVALPHVWTDAHPELLRGTYHLAFDADAAPPEELAVYLPGVNTRARVRVNGHSVGSGANVPGLASRFWLVPLYRSIPGALLVPGTNRLAVELEVSDAGTGFLSPVHIGPESRLRPAFELRRFLQVSGIQVLVIAGVSLGAFFALLSALRRKDTTYFWFAVVVWVFAFGFWNLLAIETRIPMPPYRWVGAVTMAWMVAAIVVFVHRLLGEHHPRAELGLAAGVALGSTYFALTLGTPAYEAMIPVWGAAVMGVSLYPAWRIATRFATHPDRELALVVASGVIILGAGFHDVALVNGLLPLGHDFAIQYAALASMAIFSVLFVTRFIDALDTSEALSAELAERVEQKAAEIEASHARLRVLERHRAVADERERILAEIHDGMGGQLVSALALVRGEGGAEETANAIQAALDDMRLMIHSLDDVEADLGTLLGSLRERMGRRLERSGLRLEWQIADTPPLEGFGPESALQLMRIAQEAITNVIKHAGARTIRIRTAMLGDATPRSVLLEIADDGKGFDTESGTSGGGRGLAHMRRRAERIGATLQIESGREGTRVRLRLRAATERSLPAAGGGAGEPGAD